MKKQLSVMLIFILLFSFAGAVPAQAKVYEDYPYLYADFETEDSLNEFSLFNENTAAWTKGGVGGSAGCMKAVQTKDYGGLYFTIPNGDDLIGRTFKLSVWVKLDVNTCTLKEAHDQVKFVFQGPTKSGDEVIKGSKILGVSQLGLNNGNWVYAETVVNNWDGKMDNGTIVPNYSSIDYTVMLRVGNANGQEVTKALATGSKIVYFIDDFIVEPAEEAYVSETDQTEASTVMEAIDFSNLEAKPHIDYGISSYYDSATGGRNANMNAEAGHDGKAGYLSYKSVASQNALADLYFKKYPFRYNRLYKISFWAKADDEATVGKSALLIASRNNRLDKTNDTGRYENDNYHNLVATEGLTAEWTKYDVYMMRQVKTFDETPFAVTLRVGDRKGIAYSIDDFTIEEFNAPVNGDFAWKKEDIPETKVRGGSDDSAGYGTFYGWFDKGVTVEAAEPAMGSAGAYSAKITTVETGGTMSQGVFIENNKEQQITFQAKGEGASVGKPIQIRLDRKVDNVDADDVYAVPDTELLGDNLILTEEWKEYTIPYTTAFAKPAGANDNAGPRQPFLSFVVDGGQSGMTYYIDDLAFCEKKEPYALPYVTDLALDTMNVEGSTAIISYRYRSEQSLSESGSVLRVLKKTDNGRFITIAQLAGESGVFEYTIPETEVGALLRYEILPIADKNGKRTGGAVYSIDAPAAVKKQLVVTSELGAFDLESGSVTGRLYVENNKVDGTSVQVFLGIVLYDADDEVIRITCKAVDVANMESISEVLSVGTTDDGLLPEIAKAKAFVWGGTDMVDTDMQSYAPMIEVKK